MHADTVTTERRGRGRPREIEDAVEMSVAVPGALELRLRVLGMLEGPTPDEPVAFSVYVRQALESLWENHPRRAMVEAVLAGGKAPPALKPNRRRKK